MHQPVTLKVRLGTTYKKTAVYSCMTGFTLKGLYRRTCEETGQWSDDAPTCDIKGFNISFIFIYFITTVTPSYVKRPLS